MGERGRGGIVCMKLVWQRCQQNNCEKLFAKTRSWRMFTTGNSANVHTHTHRDTHTQADRRALDALKMHKAKSKNKTNFNALAISSPAASLPSPAAN